MVCLYRYARSSNMVNRAIGLLLQKIESGTFLPHEKNPTKKSDLDRQTFTADTVCWIASCTKLMTTVAVMQCVERGILKLDEDVSEIWLPEFKEIGILTKIEEDKDGNERPIYKTRTEKITLRQLLTHSSGLAYEFTHPKLNQWRSVSSSTKEGRALGRSSDLASAMRVPLLFEPGTAWIYGYGIDWAGLAVMRATNQNLEEYMTENIWGPLRMTSTTFSLERHRPDLYNRLAGMTVRDDEGNLEDSDGGPMGKNIERVHYGGGGGCYSTANDYIKLLTSLLGTVASGSGPIPQLLTPESLKEMFSPNLSKASTEAMRAVVANPLAFGLAGNLSKSVETSFGLGGILNLGEIPSTGRKGGGMQWGGLPNLFWWISPRDGVCGCYFSQLLPPGDVLSFNLYGDFEKAVLEEKKQGSARL
jgi:CubicO group peptidase (beta-lactamase class C family)